MTSRWLTSCPKCLTLFAPKSSPSFTVRRPNWIGNFCRSARRSFSTVDGSKIHALAVASSVLGRSPNRHLDQGYSDEGVRQGPGRIWLHGEICGQQVRPGARVLVRAALGDEWTIKQGSLDEKPMHCMAVSDGIDGTSAGEAALIVTSPGRPWTRRLSCQSTHDHRHPSRRAGVSVAERKFQQSIAEHCGIDIRYLERRVQFVR